MEYSFSWFWFMIGLLATGASAALVIWHRQIADAVGSGVGSYERFKLWGLIGIGIGLLAMTNLHSVILSWFFSLLFGGM